LWRRNKNESQPRRPVSLPVKYHAGFNKSAEDFTYYFYFRGSSDTGSVAAPVNHAIESLTQSTDQVRNYTATLSLSSQSLTYKASSQADGMKNHVSSLTKIIKG